MSARILDVTPAEYQRDPCAVPALTQSVAHAMLEQSPLHAWARHPRLGGHRQESTRAENSGSLIHRLLLGAGAELAIVSAADFRTKAAQQQRDAALEEGKIPVLEHKYAEAASAAEVLRDRCADFGFEFTGRSELAIEWIEHTREGSEVLCRGMLDHVHFERGLILDVKSAADASPRRCTRNFCEYGYDVQYAAYTRALAALRPELQGRIDFVFLFLELDPPFAILPARPDGALRTLGHARWETAVRLWQRCLSSGRWPGYCEEPVTLSAPPWMLTSWEAEASEREDAA